ncbi:hypothetical protein KQ51_01084 [Candidatus Izimaplasma bacterium HR1]|jgi:hypothetical protein|uniref:hypothetical protein n=1 Tax=Candidatus Izimoplasma sp. HR1 TaxID=1541959 RepID=UPI0004F78118|nr:hypothetical protein KQ51_01084 [Candidatus Izimaplasma bacterium HR1]
MNIGLIDADLLDSGTRHPNLALMKISAWHKSKGHKTILLEEYSNLHDYDLVYISKVFSFTRIPIKFDDYNNLVLGGTGLPEFDKDLELEIEHHRPDYDLYLSFVKAKIDQGYKRAKYSDYLDYSIGFTTRGCFRKCEFCVNKKYDRVLCHSPITEFIDPVKPYIYLWDDNFLAYKDWEEILYKLNETKKPFQFRQGLDIRLMNDKKARLLAKSRYHGDYIFAFDHIEDKEIISKKLTIWKKYARKTTKLYVLCAYDSQDLKDIISVFERIKILMKFGCLPYIMRYEEYHNSEFKGMYIQLARWCNQPRFFKKMSFRQFADANQKYHKNESTFCSTLNVLRKFENEYPKIAKKYFDIRYEDLIKY